MRYCLRFLRFTAWHVASTLLLVALILVLATVYRHPLLATLNAEVGVSVFEPVALAVLVLEMVAHQRLLLAERRCARMAIDERLAEFEQQFGNSQRQGSKGGRAGGTVNGVARRAEASPGGEYVTRRQHPLKQLVKAKSGKLPNVSALLGPHVSQQLGVAASPSLPSPSIGSALGYTASLTMATSPTISLARTLCST